MKYLLIVIFINTAGVEERAEIEAENLRVCMKAVSEYTRNPIVIDAWCAKRYEM